MDGTEPSPSPLKKLHTRIMAAGYTYHRLNRDGQIEEGVAEERHDSLNQKTGNKKPTDNRLKILAIASFLIIVALVIFIAWQHFSIKSKEVCMTEECVLTSAYILGKMNTTQDPCEDFYEYACGGWEQNTNIPPDKAKYGSFQEVDTQNKALLKKVLDKDGAEYKGKNSTAVKKAKIFYHNCMNITEIDNLGIDPVLKVIKKLGSWTVTSDSLSGTWDEQKWSFLETLVHTHKLNHASLFSLIVVQDAKHSDNHIISFEQSGLSLDGQEEYSNNRSDVIREGFLGFSTRMGELLGGDNSTRDKMTAIYNFEKKLAKIFTPKEELQDPVKSYHNMTLQEFQTIIGDWISLKDYTKMLFGTELPMTEVVIVYTPEYFKKLGKVIENTSKEVLANYLVWQVIQMLPGYLPEKFIEASLILSKAETGISAVSPRWQRCVYKTSSAVPFTTGALFVQEKFSPESKVKALKVIHDIKSAFMNNLLTVDWMDEKTRDTAIEKVKAVTDMIGYPDYILDPDKLDEHYENLTIVKGQFLVNRLSILAWQKDFNLQKRGVPADRKEWHMSPADVNAYYSPANNDIVFPAGILQRPYYNPSFPMAFRYGSLGMIVGHELTHGFDSSGRNFDKTGNLYKWWTNDSAEAFKEKIKCMIDQYSQYKVEGVNLNGQYTKSENIADNGGLKTAYTAYNMAKSSAGTPVQLPGMKLTPDQLFYVGFAQIWCSYYTPEYAQQTVITDVHANAKYRVIGSVSNSEDFSKAYKCSASAAMNPKTKCKVW